MSRGRAAHSPAPTLDSIVSPGFRFYQPRDGYRINIDTVILFDFARTHAKGRVLEIGSAAGVVSLLLAKQAEVRQVTGIELDAGLHALALRNQRINNSGDKTVFINSDINDYKARFRPQSFDAVVTNPPFYRHGTGKASARRGVAAAHHDGSLTLDDTLKAARYLLKPKGLMIMLFPSLRTEDLLKQLRGFAVEVLRFVHRRSDGPSDVFLMLARKGGGRQLRIVPPLIVHEGDGYSREVLGILHPGIRGSSPSPASR